MVLPLLFAPAVAACCGACVNDIIKQPLPIDYEEESTNYDGEQRQRILNEDVVKEHPNRKVAAAAIDMMNINEQSKTEFRKQSDYNLHLDDSEPSLHTKSNSYSSVKTTRSNSSKLAPEFFIAPQAIVSQHGVEVAQTYPAYGPSFEVDDSSTTTAAWNTTLPAANNSNILSPSVHPPVGLSPLVNHWGYMDGKFSEGRIYNLVTKHEAQCVSFSPDTMLIAVGLESGNGFALYEMRRYQLLNQITTTHTVVSIQWTNRQNTNRPVHSSWNVGNGIITNILAVAGRDGTIDVFQIGYRQSCLLFHHASCTKGGIDKISITKLCTVHLSGGARCMLFLPQRRGTISADLVVGEKSGSIIILSNVPTSLEASRRMKPSLRTLATYRGCLKCIAVSRDGRLLASGDEFGAIRIHHLLPKAATTKSLFDDEIQCPIEDDDEESHISTSRSTSTNPNKPYVTATKACGDEPILIREGKIRSLVFSKNDEILFAGGHDNYVVMIDATIWKVLREIKHDGAVNSLAFNDTYRFLAVGSRDKKIRIYDTSTYHAVKEIQTTGWVTSMSWGSGQHGCLLAAKSGNNQVSVFNIQNTQLIKTGLQSRGKGSCVSFSPDGKFIARLSNKSILISSEVHNFEDVATADRRDTVYNVKWCMEDKKYLVATVGDDGYLAIYVLCTSAGIFYLELVTEMFLSLYLRGLSWSKENNMIVCGGREKKVHFISVTPTGFQERHKPVPLKGMIYSVDFAPDCVEGIRHVGLAVGTDDSGDGIVTLFDINKFEKVLEIIRPRTVRCVRYHPLNPMLAIADSGNNVIYVDLLAEQVAKEFQCSSRVNAIDFSVCGRFIALADDSGFTIREVITFNILQEILAKGRDKSLAFSASKGLYLAIDNNTHEVKILLLGPLLNSQFIPINQEIDDMPLWVLAEIYKSPDGPSMLQRFMNDGSEGSILKTVEIVKRHPHAFLTFNRKTGENCFNTAFTSGKVSLIAFAMTLLVNGSLEVKSCGRNLLMTEIPANAISLMQEMASYLPPEFVVEIISKMNFVKVPFAQPRVVPTNCLQECASPSFFDPWQLQSGTEESSRSLSKEATHHRIDLKHEHLLNPAVLPLPGLGSYAFLKALTVECPPAVFDNDAMELVLRIMWKQHIRSFFLIDFFFFIFYYFVWIAFAEHSASSSASSKVVMRTMGGVVLALNLTFTIKELVQSNFGREPDYFRSMWNLADVLALSCVYIYTGITLLFEEAPYPITEEILLWVAVFGTLCLTLKFMSYLRGFPFTGWLIAVLRQNFLDVRGFAVVMLVILIGFTAAFRLVFQSREGGCDQENCAPLFSQPIAAFFTTLQLSLLSVYDPSIFQGNENKLLVQIIFFLATTVVTVVSLNALISILGDSYSRVQEHATANQRAESAQLIVEYLSLLPKRKREQVEQRTRYFHALLKSDSQGDLLVNHEDPGLHALRALRRDISELNERSNERTRKSIEQMRNAVDGDISMLRSDVLQAVQSLSMDIKRLQRTTEAGMFNPAAGALALRNRGVMSAVNVLTNHGMIGGLFAPLKIENEVGNFFRKAT